MTKTQGHSSQCTGRKITFRLDLKKKTKAEGNQRDQTNKKEQKYTLLLRLGQEDSWRQMSKDSKYTRETGRPRERRFKSL